MWTMLLGCGLEKSTDLGGMDASGVCDATYGHIRAGFETGILEFLDGHVHIQAHLVAVLLQCHLANAATGFALAMSFSTLWPSVPSTAANLP